MASALLRTSVRRGSTFRPVVPAAPAPAPSGGEGLTVRRAVSLSPTPSSICRVLCSGAQGDHPSKSREEKIIEQVDRILATKSLPEDVVKDIGLSAIDIPREVHTKELSWYFRNSIAMVAGAIFGFSYSKITN